MRVVLLAFASVISIGMLATVGILWRASDRQCRDVEAASTRVRIDMTCCGGTLQLGVAVPRPSITPLHRAGLFGQMWRAEIVSPTPSLGVVGGDWWWIGRVPIRARLGDATVRWGNDPGRETAWLVIKAPCWSFACVLGVLSLALCTLAARVYRRPLIPGRCLRCGYDLRATPKRCPECGLGGS